MLGAGDVGARQIRGLISVVPGGQAMPPGAVLSGTSETPDGCCAQTVVEKTIDEMASERIVRCICLVILDSVAHKR